MQHTEADTIVQTVQSETRETTALRVRDDTQINPSREQIEEGTASPSAFVRNYMSRDTDGPDAGDL